MTRPENTTRTPNPEWLLGGNPDAIVAQEAAGQAQLVNSDRLPTDRRGDPKEWAELGFTFGDPDPDDPMFCPATIPDGWKRGGSDHNMWSYIVDQRGLRRVAVFYKAAFYDRSAVAHLIDVGSELSSHAIYGDGPVTVPWDLLTPDETAAAVEAARGYLTRAAENPGIYGDRVPRAQAVLDAAP